MSKRQYIFRKQTKNLIQQKKFGSDDIYYPVLEIECRL